MLVRQDNREWIMNARTESPAAEHGTQCRGGDFSSRGVLEKVLYGKALPWGPAPYIFFKIPILTEKVPLSNALALGRER